MLIEISTNFDIKWQTESICGNYDEEKKKSTEKIDIHNLQILQPKFKKGY